MPNWCQNSLFVEGDSNELQDFKRNVLVQSDHEKNSFNFTMEMLLPTPKELLEWTSCVTWRGDENDIEGKSAFENSISELTVKYGAADWLDWRISNWGTKWDVSESYITVSDDDTFAIEYDTAWSPNINFIIFACKRYPNLKFRLLYEESGFNFCGELICENAFPSLKESDMEYRDENGYPVTFDSEKNKWILSETGDVIDFDNFTPNMVSRFS